MDLAAPVAGQWYCLGSTSLGPSLQCPGAQKDGDQWGDRAVFQEMDGNAGNGDGDMRRYEKFMDM